MKAPKTSGHWYHRYVDDVHVDTVLSDQTMTTLLRDLQRKVTVGGKYEVVQHDTDSSQVILKAAR